MVTSHDSCLQSLWLKITERTLGQWQLYRAFRVLKMLLMLQLNSTWLEKSTCQAGKMGLIPELRRSPGEGNGNPFQYSCLGNPMDKGAWQTTVHKVTKESDTT